MSTDATVVQRGRRLGRVDDTATRPPCPACPREGQVALPEWNAPFSGSCAAQGGADVQDTAVVRAVLSLADNLGLRVIAEGVESDDQSDHLLRLNCPYAQGYRFSKPLPADRTTAWLAGARTPTG